MRLLSPSPSYAIPRTSRASDLSFDPVTQLSRPTLASRSTLRLSIPRLPPLPTAASKLLASAIRAGVVAASSSAKPSPSAATAAPSAPAGGDGKESFFESDVVRYGDRYNRPDRFPRLRRADARQRRVDVRDWLQRLRASARDVFVWDEGKEANGEPEGEEAAAVRGSERQEFQLLVAQGRLEEAFEVARTAMGKGCAAFALNPVSLLQAPDSSSPAAAAVDHGAFILAAVDSGNVEMAFEYAGLLPPTPSPSSSSSSSTTSPLPRGAMAVYNLLLAAYVVAGDSSAMQLALNTARRRGMAPDGLSSALLLAAATAAAAAAAGAHGEEGEADRLSEQGRVFDDACKQGHVRPGCTLEQALAACSVPFLRD